VRSAFLNQGQVCLCNSRILIESELYDKFKTDFVRKTDSLLVGDPMEMNTKLGAVISENHLNKILGYINLAEEDGGTILCGGNPVKINGNCKNGWFMSPTVIDGLENKCRVNQEEIFGPVVTLIPFSNEEEAISIANDSSYGLSATIWTQDIEKAHRTAEQLDTGTIWINCWLVRDLRTPFGGMKSSGMGREGGDEIFRFFTEPKNICFTMG
nr:aldehyde dehydrogenase family protein [Candidatus Neomarinimicrobiota bacterium]